MIKWDRSGIFGCKVDLPWLLNCKGDTYAEKIKDQFHNMEILARAERIFGRPNQNVNFLTDGYEI